LTIDSRDGGRNRDASMKSGHASSIRTSARRENVSNIDIIDKCGVKVDLCVDCTKDARENFLWTSVLEATTLALLGAY
jgi:hypothetical protein